MSLFSNIKVDVYGQFNNDTVHTFTYPVSFNPADTVSSEWLRPIEDPRAVRDKLLTPAPEVYMLYNDSNGVYYSLVTPNAQDSRNGYVAITMFVAAGRAKLAGKMIINALATLKRELVDNNNLTNEAVEKALIACGVPQLEGAPAAVAKQPVKNRPNAYRIYKSDLELEQILDNPCQDLYRAYHSIFIVSQEFAPKNTSLELLTRPVVKEYSVNMLANNCTFTERAVHDNQLVTMQFTREGFKPAQLQFTVGQGQLPQGVSLNNGVMTITEPLGIRWIPGPSRPTVDGSGRPLSINYGSEKAKKKDNSILMYSIIAFLAAFLAGLFVWWLTSDNNDRAERGSVESEVVASSSSNEPSTVKNEVVADDPAEVQKYKDDVAYMKSHDIWEKEKIKSAKAKRIVTLIENGDIDGILNSEYCLDNSDNEAINEKFNRIIGLLRNFSDDKREKAKGYLQQRGSGKSVYVGQLLFNIDDIDRGIDPDTKKQLPRASKKEESKKTEAKKDNKKESDTKKQGSEQKPAQGNSDNQRGKQSLIHN